MIRQYAFDVGRYSKHINYRLGMCPPGAHLFNNERVVHCLYVIFVCAGVANHLVCNN